MGTTIVPLPVGTSFRREAAIVSVWGPWRHGVRSGIRMRARGDRWLLAVLALVGGLPEAAGARPATVAVRSMPLDVLSFREAESVEVVGTGCVWRGGAGRRNRMSMADDRGAVKRKGRLVSLRPAPDAKALFLTFDRWIGGGMRIAVHDTGRVVRRGYELTETVARLDIVEAGRSRSFPGRLACGS